MSYKIQKTIQKEDIEDASSRLADVQAEDVSSQEDSKTGFQIPELKINQELNSNVQKEIARVENSEETNSDSYISRLSRIVNSVSSYLTGRGDPVVSNFMALLGYGSNYNHFLFVRTVFAFDGFFSGSSVLAASLGKKTNWNGDIDVYIPASKKELFFAFLKKYWNDKLEFVTVENRYTQSTTVIEKKLDKFIEYIDSVYEANVNSVTVIQIIFCKDEWMQNPADIVDQFDISVCKKYIDQNGYVNRSPSHLKPMEFVMKCNYPRDTSLKRFNKYCNRGFTFVKGYMEDDCTTNPEMYRQWITPSEN